MKNGITIAGNLIIDIVKKIDGYPKEGMLANIHEVNKCMGGCVGNTLYDLAVIDNTLLLAAIARVGNDYHGRYMMDKLTGLGISTKGVCMTEDDSTSFTDVMVNCHSGERTFFHERGANAGFSIEHIDVEALECDIFHIGYVLLLDSFDKEDDVYGTVMAKTLAKVQGKGIKTSLDVVSENSKRYKKIVRPSLKYCNYVILNEIEASNTVGIPIRDLNNELMYEQLPKICKGLFDLGVSDLVVIHMPECGCAMTNDGSYVIQASYHLPEGFIKGAVGAGDAFCAGILYGIYNEWSVDDSIKFANMSAACCLSSENSIDGMKTKDEIHQMQSEFSLRQIDHKAS